MSKGRSKGALREITKAQAGKRAQIEKLIEAERKKAKPKPVSTVRPNARPNVRPIVRLPGQPLPPGSGQLAARPNQKRGRQFLPHPLGLPVIPIPPSPGRPRNICVNLPMPQQVQQPIEEKKFNFLLLPGELRNKIYGYAFPEEFFQLQFIKKTTDSLTYSLPKCGKLGPYIGPSAGRRRRLFDYPRRVHSKEIIPPYRLSPGPAALLLTCKKINEEATPIFYGSSIFSFNVPNTLRVFLKALRPETKQSIMSLALKHYTAGNPRWTEFQPWKCRDDNRWDDLLWDASDELVSLDYLSIDLVINDIPLLFGPNVHWKMPFLAFQEMGIKKCDVKLRHQPTLDTVLEVEQMILKRDIMGKEYKEEEEELEEEKKLAAGRRRRTRVLNVVNP